MPTNFTDNTTNLTSFSREMLIHILESGTQDLATPYQVLRVFKGEAPTDAEIFCHPHILPEAFQYSEEYENGNSTLLIETVPFRIYGEFKSTDDPHDEGKNADVGNEIKQTIKKLLLTASDYEHDSEYDTQAVVENINITIERAASDYNASEQKGQFIIFGEIKYQVRYL